VVIGARHGVRGGWELVRRLVQRGADGEVAAEPQTARDYYPAAAEILRRSAGSASVSSGGGDLQPFEYRASSQNGEDGLIVEILRRTGSAGGYFVEFGIGPGSEGNCILLADLLGWSGLFIEADAVPHAILEKKYRWNSGVMTLCKTVTPENVDSVLQRAGIPAEPDILSIDVNGVDYWIWRALEAFRPRVVIIEYNSTLSPIDRLTVPRAFAGWDGSDYFGASLAHSVRWGRQRAIAWFTPIWLVSMRSSSVRTCPANGPTLHASTGRTTSSAGRARRFRRIRQTALNVPTRSIHPCRWCQWLPLP